MEKLGRNTWSGRKRYLVEVEPVKANRTKKDKKTVTQFERSVTEGNEKADELAKAGAMLDEGFMAEARSETMQQEREEVYAALQYAVSFHCLVEQWKDCERRKPKPKEKWFFVDKKGEETKHRTEWCADADKYRCMRCGRCQENVQAGADGYPRVWQNVEVDSSPGRWQGPRKTGKKLNDRRTKEKNHKKRVSEASDQV